MKNIGGIMKNKGFTLTELLAVIAIIAILSVAAISGYSAMTKNSKEKTLNTKVSAIENAAYKYAKENNIDRKTTISVNKLVTMGYLQADESSDEGLSVYSNPVSGENMICNTVDLTIVNNDVVVKYNTTNKNCSLANEEEDAAKIRVTAYCPSGSELSLAGDTFAWTSCDQVYLRTNPNTGINVGDIESISFDYDGNSVVKKTGTMAGGNTTANIENTKNVIAVPGVADQVITTDVGITYTMKNGKVYFRHAIVRIDKQKPTLTYVLKNDTTGNANGLRRTLTVYVDDANGSGSNGFYMAKGTGFAGAIYKTTTYKWSELVDLGTWFLTPKDNVGNIGEYKMITLDNISEDLSCELQLFNSSDRTTRAERSNNWYNFSIDIMQYAKGYKNGVSYDILKGTTVTNRGQLRYYKEENQELRYYHPTESNEMPITLFQGGLWNVQKKTISKCNKNAGIDKTKSDVTFSPNYHNTYEQYHNVVVVVQDNGAVPSGFYSNGKDMMQSGQPKYTLWYAWVPSSITNEASVPVTKWRKNNNPTADMSAAYKLTDSTTRRITFEIKNERTDYNSSYMTGDYRLIVKSGTIQDLAANYNKSSYSAIFKMDNTVPHCERLGMYSHGTYGTNNWYITNVSFSHDNNAPDDHSQLAKIDTPATLTSDTTSHTAVFKATDKAGNWCTNSITVKRDTTNPTCGTINLPTPNGENNWYTSNVTVTKSNGSDATSGHLSTTIDKTSITTESGTNIVTLVTTDYAGHKCTTTKNVPLDKTNPGCTYTDNSSWTNSNVTIKLGCTDGTSGCASTEKTETFTSGDDTKTKAMSYTAKDRAGLTKDCSKTMNVYHDAVAPNCSITDKAGYDNDGASYKVHCTDHTGGSGLKKCAGDDVSGNDRKVSKTRKTDHTHEVYDNAGNKGTCKVDIESSTRYIKKDVPYQDCKWVSAGTHQAAGASCVGYAQQYGKCGSPYTGTNGNYYCDCQKESCETKYKCGSNWGSWGGSDTGCTSQKGYKAK